MPRPHKCRYVGDAPVVTVFKPAGIPAKSLELVELRLDELEALRLADREGLYQEQAAQKMGISRATFGRLLEQAHRKVAQALFEGKGLSFTGGAVASPIVRGFVCRNCGKQFDVPPGAAHPSECPYCQSHDISVVPETSVELPFVGSRGRGGGRRCRFRGGRGG